MTIYNIEQLAYSITQEKRLEFTVDELSINNELVESEILERHKNKYIVKDFNVITPLILNIYKKKFEFETQNDFRKNVSFLEDLIKDFNSNGFVPNSRKLSKHLLIELIKESNQTYNCSFVGYIKYLEESRDRERILSFIDSYQSIMGDLHLSIDDYYSNVIKLLKLSTSDAEINDPLSNILRSVRVKCRNETKFAHNLFSLSLQAENHNVNFQANIIAALYETEKINFYNNYLKVKLENRECESAILWGLAFSRNINEKDCLLFIEIFRDKHQVTALSIPSLALLFSIVKTPFKQFYDFCFKEFNNCLENEANSQYLLREFRNLKGFAAEKLEFLKKFILLDYFSSEIHLFNIVLLLKRINTFDSFKCIHYGLIERFPSIKFAEAFQSLTPLYDLISFDKYLIELLSDNRPEIRFAGLDMFEQLSSNTPYRFEYDITNLPLQTQVNLHRSLFYRDADPNFFLPALIPLLEQKDKEAAELFIEHLEKTALDYPSEVLRVLDRYLDSSKSGHIIERIKNYVDDYFIKNVDPKNKIIEFNPLQTQLEFLRLFNTLQEKRVKRMLHDNMKAHKGVLGMFSKNQIYLAKGGGYKMEGNQPISKLNRFSKSMTLGRRSLYDPSNFEFNRLVFSRINWELLDEYLRTNE